MGAPQEYREVPPKAEHCNAAWQGLGECVADRSWNEGTGHSPPRGGGASEATVGSLRLCRVTCLEAHTHRDRLVAARGGRGVGE